MMMHSGRAAINFADPHWGFTATDAMIWLTKTGHNNWCDSRLAGIRNEVATLDGPILKLEH
jgi:hypothetical protein